MFTRSIRSRAVAIALAALFPVTARAATGVCDISPKFVSLIMAQLKTVVALSDANGGIFAPNQAWAAIVDRKGVLCDVIKTGDAWPAGRAAAIAAATTANGFSNAKLALSTANLYAAAQPGGWLAGLDSTNPFNPALQPQGTGVGAAPGGISAVGGGVALYHNGLALGGLGVSGDSTCADHAIGFRMRRLAAFDAVPAGQAPDDTDNIIYAPAGSTPTGFEHPHCFPSDLTPAQVETIPAR